MIPKGTAVHLLGVLMGVLGLGAPALSSAGTVPEIRPPVMRIGLSVGEGRVVVLSSQSGLHLVSRSDQQPVWKERYRGEVRIVLLGGGGVQTIYRVQVGSFNREAGARDLAARLERELQVPASVHHDAQRHVFRVRMGEFRARTGASGLTSRLAGMGFEDAWIAAEDRAATSEASLRVVDDEFDSRVIGHRELMAFSDGRRLLSINGRRYRGQVEILMGDTGRLAVVNAVNLEDYLRGVVPEEMGPGVYPRLQALEAQSVAARTYAVRNRGQFSEQGYDICDSARCQVYGGADSEHPLTDRAVTRTAGEVLTYNGGLVNALFTSTCGGHTEDVANVFPEQVEPYLKGVPCRPESELAAGVMKRLSGTGRLRFLAQAPGLAQAAARLQVTGVLRREDVTTGVLSGTLPPQIWRRWIGHLAALLGRSLGPEPPSPGDRLGLGRAALDLVHLLDWGERESRLLPAADVAVLLGGEAGSPMPEGEEPRALALLVQTGLVGPVAFPAPWSEELSAAQAVRVLDLLVRQYGAPVLEEVRIKSLKGPRLELSSGVSRALAAEAYLFQPLEKGGQKVPVRSLPLTLNEPISIHLDESGNIDYLEARRPFRTLDDDRFSSRLMWEVKVGRHELGARLDRSLSLGELIDLRIVARGISGRVTELEVVGSRRRVRLKGFDIRVALKLDETFFTVNRWRNQEGGIESFVFAGRGWGHGVGLCQVGAYGMAVRGRNYLQILTHYYTGVRLDSLSVHPDLLGVTEKTPLK